MDKGACPPLDSRNLTRKPACFDIIFAMSEEAKIIAFVAFCVESYKVAKNLSGGDVSSLFSELLQIVENVSPHNLKSPGRIAI